MKSVKMSFKNKDGKMIYKPIPENLVSNYLRIGWEIVKETKLNEPKPSENRPRTNNE